MYAATKSENEEISYTLTDSRLGTTDERYCPGETVTVNFPTRAADGTAYTYGYGSSGSVAGYGGATDNGWTISSLPIASTDASARTKLTLVCPEEPLYAVGVYGEIEIPKVDPTPPDPIVVTPPAPNYIDSNYPSLQWNHHSGGVHVKDSQDSTAGSTAINQNFNCEIRTDTTLSDSFDTEQGIPSSEYESIQANVETYQTCGQIRQHDIKAWYYVTVSKLYYWYTTESYTTKNDKGEEVVHYYQQYHDQTVSRTYKIYRYITYWTTDWFYVWHPKDLTVWNGSFPDPLYITMDAYKNPGEVSKVVSKSVGEFVHATYDPNVYLGAEQGYPPADVNWEDVAEKHVGSLKAQNDQTTFWNDKGKKEVILQDGLTTAPQAPIKPSEPGMTPDYVYYKSGIQIPPERLNDDYSSKAAVHYELSSSAGTANDCCEPATDMNYGIPTNNVIVHTPVVNGFAIKKDNTYVQMVLPTLDKQIVLDTKFTIDIPEVGYHLDIPAYGYKNYSKYVERWEVQFPIDVYSVDGSVFYPKNTWFEVDSGETEFLAAAWNDEVPGTFKSRTIAINCLPNGKILEQEDSYNASRDNYVARNYDVAEISGRVYGLNIFDVSDYPIWQSVFRVKNTYAKSGTVYKSGLANQNGVINPINKASKTFPMVNGDHPEYPNEGVLRPGYNVRFQLTTVGDMADGDDYVRIVPKFYYINKKTGVRQEVDVYYDETINGVYQRLVQIGSPLDLTNKKSSNIRDDVYYISNTVLSETAKMLGYKSISNWTADSKNVFTFGNIMIPASMRTFYGTWHATLTPDSPVTGKKLVLPNGVAYREKSESVQQWWCSYYLPASIHVVPKGYDVRTPATTVGIDYKEDFWLKDGYLMLNFDIYTLNGGKPRLRYGETNNCDMWQMEKKLGQKRDSSGKVISFQEGDFVLFDLDRTALDDYTSGGTH
ncbi:DUF5704 domain-containing protein [Acetivibrio ethanolgignens]|uniref:DUF5704 domain-containing protein n=1 Tax=Acetivibrio ethanolgignens TaxID=290052 RepID=UPI001A9A5FF4|nr:DUF5704 domain-containing protein [Acetivibrio ethanolgignens]